MGDIRKIKLLVSIVERGMGEKVVGIYRKHNVVINLICLGKGTASSEILDSSNGVQNGTRSAALVAPPINTGRTPSAMGSRVPV